MNSPLLDLGYRHWNGTIQNVWVRRATVARHTMQVCLRGRVIRFLVAVTWMLSLATATAYFAVGQILVPEGLLRPLFDLIMDDRARRFVEGISAWLALYPDVTVRAVANLLLLHLTMVLQTISFLVVTLIISRLLTRDLASNAIVVYSSRAISRFDYLFGKLVGLLGVFSLCWLGPAVMAWILGNVVAPDWSFFWHSRSALGYILITVIPSMVVSALLAMAISALSAKSRTSVAIWLIVWLLTPVFVPIAKMTGAWVAYLNINYVLDRFAIAIFDPYRDFSLARETLPFFNTLFGQIKESFVQSCGHASLAGPAVSLLIVSILSLLILFRRTRS